MPVDTRRLGLNLGLSPHQRAEFRQATAAGNLGAFLDEHNLTERFERRLGNSPTRDAATGYFRQNAQASKNPAGGSTSPGGASGFQLNPNAPRNSGVLAQKKGGGHPHRVEQMPGGSERRDAAAEWKNPAGNTSPVVPPKSSQQPTNATNALPGPLSSTGRLQPVSSPAIRSSGRCVRHGPHTAPAWLE